MDNNQKSILDMARGAIQERADYEMSRIIGNILDANTKAAAARAGGKEKLLLLTRL